MAQNPDAVDGSDSNTDRSRSDDRLDWIRLNLVSGVGPRLRQALLERFETPGQILAATANELIEVPGIGRRLADAIVNCNNRVVAVGEMEKCDELGIKLVTPFDQGYPRLLKQIADPPGILYIRGSLQPVDNLAIAVVGTRHATRYGINQTCRLVSGLARAGYTIVSGLARGIDSAAHQAALDAGGRTIAVLGSGLLEIYPPENRDLAAAIAANGAVVSENPLYRKPKGPAFPQRNRIVTGMSLGVVVIEASNRSGALISARHAMEQNREVFAMPGRVDSLMSTGCHQLIRDGAKLIDQVDHIIEEFGPLAEKTVDPQGHEVHHPAELQLNEQERQVLDAIQEDSVSLDQVVERTGLSVSRVLSTISVLEMKRLIRRVSGNQVSRYH